MMIDQKSVSESNWRIVVNSIGDSGAGLVSVLKTVSPFSEERIASLLYQAPAELIPNLTYETGQNVQQLLTETGLDCQLVDEHYTLEPGDAAHEVALVLRDFTNVTTVLEQIIKLLGVDLETARKIICRSPSVLVGSISKNTVAEMKRRFGPLGVELDVSCPAEASFDLFIDDCPAVTRQQVMQQLRDQSISVLGTADSDQPLLAAELTKIQADKLWERFQRSAFPVRFLNRDFQRFDLRLDQASSNPKLIPYLVASTGMPEKVAHKVIKNTPIVLQQNIRFDDLMEQLAQITALEAEASGHLLAFQTFALTMEEVTDFKNTLTVIRFVTGLSEAQALEAVDQKKVAAEALTPPQAHWLQAALKSVGVESSLELL